MGATRQALVNRFIGEAIILSFIATLLAIFLLSVLLPFFNMLVEKDLVLNLFSPLHFFSLITIALICGLLAGSYPAFYLSGFNPATVLKNIKRKGGSEGFIRKGLVVTQFAASVIFIVAAIVIYQQITYSKKRDIGFDRQNLIYCGLQGNMKAHFNTIKNELISSGAAENAKLASVTYWKAVIPATGLVGSGKAPDKQVLISFETVSPEYVSTMGMKLNAGSDFYSNISGDSNHIIINETLAKIIGEKNAVGTVISSGSQRLMVMGVIRDFTFGNVFKTSAPFMLFPDTTNVYTLTIRLKNAGDLQHSLAKIAQVMKANNPGYPFEYKFVDEEFNEYFKTEMLTGKLVAIFSALAILISCMGLFGLAAYTAERRTKEIGIRKVLGANVVSVTGLLSKDFLKLVGLACLIAFPVSWWLMYNWLRNYSYRIGLSWWFFTITGLLVLFIALFTVSFQVIEAALANPVKSQETNKRVV